MGMKLVKMHYVGPGFEADPRVLEVTPDEAEALAERGLFAKSKPKPDKKEEVKSNG